MEKTTKKKKSKGLKRRIGIIAIGGLSLVLTICLSVGATLAWFAGSTSASNTMYMGGPVYVEMAGRGAATNVTAGNGTSTAKWVGGQGNLDIMAAARDTGTAGDTANFPYGQVLLPGQKLMVYSQARVFSTSETTTIDDGAIVSQNSGANTANMTNGTASYRNKAGRVTTTTTSVLRAKFSIDVEFDPSVGINNFTQSTYAFNYPVRSAAYTGDGASQTPADNTWVKALDAQAISGVEGSYSGRRDAVKSCDATTNADASSKFYKSELTKPTETDTELMNIKKGIKSSIYEWKFVSGEVYRAANSKWQMKTPFDGTINSAGNASNTNADGTTNQSGSGNGFYGLWVASNDTYDDATGDYVESEAFYKARCNAYLSSYKEHYVDEYERELVMQTKRSLTSLEEALNNSFVDLVNQSSDKILSGFVNGFTVTEDGRLTNVAAGTAVTASWLYVDPSVAPDTNSGASATSLGGWWYLVESTGAVTTAANSVSTVKDVVTGDSASTYLNTPTAGAAFVRAGNVNGLLEGKDHVYSGGASNATDEKGWGYTGQSPAAAPATATIVDKTDSAILYAKLYEITPSVATEEVVGKNHKSDNTDVNIVKTVSVSFPFVNGAFELPGKELTNNFANAKITFKISFQALQAFLPYTKSIDNLHTGNALLGTPHALNIGNAVPIFNEAFDYLAYLNV